MSCNCRCTCSQPKTIFAVGDEIHGFCGGYFGRDDYDCKRVEHIGYDYIVWRYLRGGVTISSAKSHEEIYQRLSKYMEPDEDTCYCNEW